MVVRGGGGGDSLTGAGLPIGVVPVSLFGVVGVPLLGGTIAGGVAPQRTGER
jgi:hypothetical protein